MYDKTIHDDGRQVEYVLPVRIPNSDVEIARGVRAGPWLFATGQAGTDYVNGLAPEVVQTGHPLNGVPKGKREARRIYQNVAEVLQAGGSSLERVVRVDQYYTRPEVVDSYHEVRREVFNGRIPPSTSNLHQRLAIADQEIELQVIASAGDGPVPQHEAFSPSYAIHSSSGYSPALRCGAFRFIPGQTAEARDEAEPGVDPLAHPSRGLWKGTPIKLETDFIIQEKMRPSLEACGCRLEDVVKAQVYLRDQQDVPAFNEIWAKHFPEQPATTIIPTADPGFIIPGSRIEINVIAVDQTQSPKTVMSLPTSPLFAGGTHAVRCGDLLFLSGLMGCDEDGLVANARGSAGFPFHQNTLRAEMDAIITQAERICEAAGTSIRNVVRIQQFHTQLDDLGTALDAWSNTTGGALPVSAVEVPWLPLPGARVLVDLWCYCP